MVAPPALKAGALGAAVEASGGGADAAAVLPPTGMVVPRPGSVIVGAESPLGSLPPENNARSVRAMRNASAFLR